MFKLLRAALQPWVTVALGQGHWHDLQVSARQSASASELLKMTVISKMEPGALGRPSSVLPVDLARAAPAAELTGSNL